MASFSSPTFPSPSTRTDPSPYKLLNFTSPKLKRSVNYNYNSHSRVSDPSSTLRRCKGSSGNGDGSSESPSTPRRWDTAIQEALKSAIKRFDDFVNAKSINVAERENELKNDEDDEEWDWERWKQHFKEVDEQERVVSILKSQLAQAVNMENYEDAARLKVAIAAAAANDTVGRVMSHLNKALEEERYREAALIRDDACAGLVGWWAGISENTGDPYGCIIQISAEHGRYVARSYSPRQLATAADGAPLFEIFLAMNKEGEYMQQAVYLKRSRAPVDLPIISPKSSVAMGSLDPLGPTENKTDLFEKDSEDTEDTEDSDNNSGFENVLRDMIPGVEVKVLKVTTPGKVDRDFISKVVEQIIEDEDEEDEEKDFELESVDSENESKGETDEEKNEIELDATSEISSAEEQSEIAVKLVVGGLVQKSSIGKQHKELLRVPATLEKKGLTSFTFTVEEEDSKDISDSNGHSSPNKKAKLLNPRSVDHLMLDLAKSIGRGRIPMKVLKDVGEMINLTLSQARNRQPLSGSTTFNRIDIPASRDPLNGLYIGAHGLYTSEVIQLRRRYGQWKGDGNSKEPSDIEFYEYVEAVKLTGDPYVPAGQIAFRAKIGKRYQLPHKGIIPEEFGVIARYRGQGRLAEPGFRNPRWVDGELVILDGKYIRGGPVVGFVYWAPEYHFLVFFNRLRLQE